MAQAGASFGMPLVTSCYRAGTRLLGAAAPLGGALYPTLRAAVRARAESQRLFAAPENQVGSDPGPTLVFHGASAGELRHAEPVLRRIRARHRDWRLVITYFSPSAVPVAAQLAADLHGFLPWDSPAPVRRFLSSLNPAAIIVSKLDLWPTLAEEATRRGIGLGLIAGAVRARSGRLRWPARAALRPAYSALDFAAACEPEDAEPLLRLGVRPDRLMVTGDPRFDGVLERLAEEAAVERHAATLVAGSTWPEDEGVLLTAFAAVRKAEPTACLLLVPHEPTAAALDRIIGRAASIGVPAARYQAGLVAPPPVLVVDRVGDLGLLYRTGSMALVGGGFGQVGLHSVLEPAAAGVPVLAGPLADRDRVACRLREAGALEVLPSVGAVDALTRIWLRWLRNPAEREGTGRKGRAVVERGRGAADRSTDLVSALVEMKTGQVNDPPRATPGPE
jgi:3-deoxy-D-manno-octulosonic-acid transferase